MNRGKSLFKFPHYLSNHSQSAGIDFRTDAVPNIPRIPQYVLNINQNRCIM